MQRVTHKLPYKLELVETEEPLHAGQALDPEREIQESDIFDSDCDRRLYREPVYIAECVNCEECLKSGRIACL
jgi:hypothetical protein